MRSWNLLSVHRPAAVVRAECAEDVVATIGYAAGAGLGVAVLTTGHGTPSVGPGHRGGAGNRVLG